LDSNFNFVNVADPANPTRLKLDLSERCELVFTLSDQLVRAGWLFQERPIGFVDDYGVNFSSYIWVDHEFEGQLVPRTSFKIIFECLRMGIYTYSLFMTDSFGQNLDLDPKIENGAGHG
jgi:hypothetical protein